MGKRKKLIWIFSSLFLISCNLDYSNTYINKKDPNNTFIVKTIDNREKLILSIVYKNQIEDNLYYLKVNDEFYQCNEMFSKNSIGKIVQFSTIREYNIPSKLNIASDRLIIKKEGDIFVTINNMADYSGTITIKYFYDKDYKILKIEDRGKIYDIKQ